MCTAHFHYVRTRFACSKRIKSQETKIHSDNRSISFVIASPLKNIQLTILITYFKKQTGPKLFGHAHVFRKIKMLFSCVCKNGFVNSQLLMIILHSITPLMFILYNFIYFAYMLYFGFYIHTLTELEQRL